MSVMRNLFAIKSDWTNPKRRVKPEQDAKKSVKMRTKNKATLEEKGVVDGGGVREMKGRLESQLAPGRGDRMQTGVA